MAKVKAGFAFHCHHDVLMEWCYNFGKRVKFIKDNKPKREQALRLRLFKLIPPDRLPPELVKAGEAYSKAGKGYSKEWEAYSKARRTHIPEIIKLHQELCPDCPWDGQTIFSLK